MRTMRVYRIRMFFVIGVSLCIIFAWLLWKPNADRTTASETGANENPAIIQRKIYPFFTDDEAGDPRNKDESQLISEKQNRKVKILESPDVLKKILKNESKGKQPPALKKEGRKRPQPPSPEEKPKEQPITNLKEAPRKGDLPPKKQRHEVKSKQNKKTKVRIHVVEEHHEVLPYWFLAVKEGILPEKGNTLLHIDGHSDDAPPDMMDGYPMYRRPANNTELLLMLQSNDIFIKAAIMAGMFDRFIWVWPEWDRVNHNESHAKVNVDYGNLVVEENNKSVTYFCACMSMEKQSKCLIYNRTAYEENPDGSEEQTLPRGRCKIRGRYLYEEVSETDATTLIRGGWIKQHEKVLIDIDEDFFGCESSGSALKKAGVNWQRIQDINNNLNDIICPRKTIHERPASEFIMNILKNIMKECESSVKMCSLTDYQIRNITSIALKDATAIKMPFLCNINQKILQLYLKSLVKKFIKMTPQQMKLLSKLGFCMLTTPKSLFFSNSKAPGIGEFQVCSGVNPPDDPVVLYHSPDETEVTRRVRLLNEMIGRGNYPSPRLVTVCRSVRDGYTPRKHFSKIEYGILNATATKIGKEKYMIYYDRDLLGGKQGYHLNKG